MVADARNAIAVVHLYGRESWVLRERLGQNLTRRAQVAAVEACAAVDLQSVEVRWVDLEDRLDDLLGAGLVAVPGAFQCAGDLLINPVHVYIVGY